MRALPLLLALVAPAHAEPADRPHAVYVELLGKGGLWGLGYDWQPTPRVAIGAVASFYQLDGDRFTTLAPYVAVYPLLHGRHRAFVQGGPDVVRRATPSPGPEWQGMATTAYSGEVSVGYEYRTAVLVRAYAIVGIGERVAPSIGASLGWTF